MSAVQPVVASAAEQAVIYRHRSTVAVVSLYLIVLSMILISGLPYFNQINKLIFALCSLIVVVVAVSGSRPIRLALPFMLATAWVIYAIVPSLLSQAPQVSLAKLFTVSLVLFMAVLCYNILLWQGRYKGLLWVFYLSVLMTSLVGFTTLSDIQLGENRIGQQHGRHTGTTSNANSYGVLLVFGCYAGIYLYFLEHRRWLKWAALGGLLVLCLGIVSTASRTALLGLLLLLFCSSLAFGVWSLRRPGRLLGFIAALVTLIAVFTVALITNPVAQKRYQQFLDVAEQGDLSERSAGSSLSGRASLIGITFNLVGDYPLGIGMDNMRLYAGVYAHSNPLELLATTGVPGIILYYAIYLSLLLGILRLPTRWTDPVERRLLIVFVVLLVFIDFVNVSYYRKEVWLLIAVVAAITELKRREARFNIYQWQQQQLQGKQSSQKRQ